MKKILFLGFMMILVGIGCEKASFIEDTSALLKTQWVLSYIQDSKTNAITNYPTDAARKISIVFSDSLNLILFHGICNGGWGNFSYSPNSGDIQITVIGTTKIACKYCEWERYTIENLANAFSYKINGNYLEIFTSTYNLYFTQN
jgi:heat shock protein HslJ